MAKNHKNTWEKCDISFTDFIRTSSSKHKKLVQKILDITYKN
jgi:methionyl-tRNA synthetase